MKSVNVVFDVGRVLIDFSYTDFFARLQQRGARIADEDEFAERVGLIRYELGQISNREFLSGMNALLDDPFPEAELIAAWTSIFTPAQRMLELAGTLKQHCGVYLLSNTSELHWQHLQSAFELKRLCHDLLASYEVGFMKPAPEIFLTAQERFGLTPETTVFIDDRQDNVAGAEACGWRGIWHRDQAETIRQLHRLAGIDR